ncbi:Bystin [Diplonema papillatum]|nr:Bystin [Diplonema papillatum]
MGKQVPSKKKFSEKHDPLATQLTNDKEATPSARRAALRDRRSRRKKAETTDDDACGHGGLERDNDGFLIPSHLSSKLLQEARKQQQEIEKEEAGMDEDEDVELEYDDQSSVQSETPIEEAPDFAVDAEEERLLQQFAPQSNLQSRNLADIIMAKIREKERNAAGEAMSRASRSDAGGTKFDPRVVKIYKTIGKVLKKYTTGKIPKAFKVLPNLQGWEELIWLTAPHEWSPHALYAATRLFAHTANEKMTQRFYNGILLPSIRSAFRNTGKLHSHAYAAVRKALWKPAAFNKGFLLPLAAEPDLTMKEALVVSSILSKTSMPRAHAMVAVAKMTQMPYNGSSSILLRVLLDKKYDLAYQVIDMLVKHFHEFVRDLRELPVLWHQCLLTFVQRYKEHFVEEQVDLIRKLVNKHNHMLISSEIRRELIMLETEWKKAGGRPPRAMKPPMSVIS